MSSRQNLDSMADALRAAEADLASVAAAGADDPGHGEYLSPASSGDSFIMLPDGVGGSDGAGTTLEVAGGGLAVGGL